MCSMYYLLNCLNVSKINTENKIILIANQNILHDLLYKQNSYLLSQFGFDTFLESRLLVSQYGKYHRKYGNIFYEEMEERDLKVQNIKK